VDCCGAAGSGQADFSGSGGGAAGAGAWAVDDAQATLAIAPSSNAVWR
jgi:hypothetical protein